MNEQEWTDLENLRPYFVPSEKPVTIYNIRKTAKEMGLAENSALRMRMRYLAGDSDQPGMLQAAMDYAEGKTDDVPKLGADEIVSELIKLKKSREYKEPIKDDVTDEMVDRARQFPVDQLIEFVHGKARCFAHKDKLPTMYFATRNNTANCPACNKTWNSIGILMARDGYSFKSAVRELCR